MRAVPSRSGTTGRPKGCMLTHRNVMHTLLSNTVWFGSHQDTNQLVVLPFFHVTSMQGGMNGPLYHGSTIVLMCRWDRDTAAELIQRYQLMSWTAIATQRSLPSRSPQGKTPCGAAWRERLPARVSASPLAV